MFKPDGNFYDIQNAKKAILSNLWNVYERIWEADGINTRLEEEIMLASLFRILEEDTGSREQYKNLLGVAYMLQGIDENLRLRCTAKTDETEPERAESTENGFSFFDDKDFSF